jgi:hypothetical protein
MSESFDESSSNSNEAAENEESPSKNANTNAQHTLMLHNPKFQLSSSTTQAIPSPSMG